MILGLHPSFTFSFFPETFFRRTLSLEVLGNGLCPCFIFLGLHPAIHDPPPFVLFPVFSFL